MGVFLPIRKNFNSSIFRLNSVNYEQDSMSVKHNAFLMNKLHPSLNHSLSLRLFISVFDNVLLEHGWLLEFIPLTVHIDYCGLNG